MLQSHKLLLFDRRAATLAEQHETLGNHPEHGYSLLLREEQLDWATDAPRKRELCAAAIKAFAQAKMWEACIKVSRHLAGGLEARYDYPELAAALREQAGFLDRITSGDRSLPNFYRVVLHGHGFSEQERGQAYVHRSLQSESVREFTEGIRRQYPAATVVNTSAPPPPYVVDPNTTQRDKHWEEDVDYSNVQ